MKTTPQKQSKQAVCYYTVLAISVKRRWSLLFSLFIGCFLMSCQNQQPPAIERTPLYEVTDKTQTVGVYDYQNFTRFLQAENDTTYVINFWATWCKPCVEELPYFQQLATEYQDQKVRFIFVSLDFEKQLEKKLLPFLKENKLKGEVIVLTQKRMNDWIGKIDKNWSGNLPATLIYNPSGQEFYPHSFEYETLKKALEKRLN